MPSIAAPAPNPGRRPNDRTARLNLTITTKNVVSIYTVSARQCGADVKSWRLRRSDGTDCLVSSVRGRGLHCTCAERQRNPERPCVHIGAMRAAGLLGRE